MQVQALAACPEAYRRWRSSALGRITDDLERTLILELCGQLDGLRVLDAGCGDGDLARTLARRGAVVTGLDADPGMLAAARLRLQAENCTAALVRGDVQALPFRDCSFDVVTAVTVLCLISNPRRAVLEMARVLKPGGRIVIGELGRTSLWTAIRHLRGWLGSPTWRSAHFWTAADLRALLSSANLRIETVRGAIFYPPVGLLATLMSKSDPWLGRRTSLGAAFIGVTAKKVDASL